MADLDFDIRGHLPGRAIIPLHPQLTDKSARSFSRAAGFDAIELPDLDDVQGDIIYLFPKKEQNFIFFRIQDLSLFRAALAKFEPSTSKQTASFIFEIADRKRRAVRGASLPMIPKSNLQIAFSRIGLNALGVKDATGDDRFDNRAMRDDKSFLGDQRNWDPIFEKTNFDPIDGSVNDDAAGALHGVITVAASDKKTCSDASNAIKILFGVSISVKGTIEGSARPGEEAGHEHFGYEDGVSQPALRDLTRARPGQIQVNPGVIILGYKGDPVLDDPDTIIKRPAWTKGGTMMVFRKLEQDVPEFNEYLKRNGKRWREFAPPGRPELTDDEGAELWGARMLGRWKSGAPLASCPFKDNKELASDPDKNNNFDYRVRGVPGVSSREISDHFCPFTAHTRKTAPRDLDPFVQQAFLESSMIVRAGLPYGPEVTAEEHRRGTSSADEDKKRGLLFVCYQSNLDQGFVRQTNSFATNNYFPTASLVPQNHGTDPILGGPPPQGSVQQVNEVKYVPKNPLVKPRTGDHVNLVIDFDGDKVSVAGIVSVQPAAAVDPPGVPQDFFVTSRGGEYFFVPPISALQDWAKMTGPGSMLDLLFIVDATSNMQNYIDEMRTRLENILDGVVASGKYAPRDVRVGLIVFRDHPQPNRSGSLQEFGFIAREYGFETNIHVVKDWLKDLQAEGGGDGPEAQCDALAAAVKVAWRSGAEKIAVMITDSPPHGIGEDGDRIPQGCPLQNDCVRAARLMADAGIVLHVVACEPTFSDGFSTAHDFYRGITQIAGGKLTPLLDYKQLCDLIVGHVVESADTLSLATQYSADITSRARTGATPAQITEALHSELRAAGVQAYSFAVESIYVLNSDGDYNSRVWAQARQIDSATKAQLREVRGFRIKEGSQQTLNMKLEKQPISLVQVAAVVAAGLRRK